MSRKYWDLDSEEYTDKKCHLIEYLLKNKGNIKQIERERALDLGEQLDDEAFIEYVESLNDKFNNQYKAAFRKYKSDHPFMGEDGSGSKSKPVRLSAMAQVYLDRMVALYNIDEPEKADKANSKSELLENAIEHFLNIRAKEDVNLSSVK